MSTTTPSSDDYIVDLLLEGGRRCRRIGHGSDEESANEAFEMTVLRYPYNDVRLRLGDQILEYHCGRPFYAPTSSASQ
jgi:hypothetical protein